MIRLFAKNYKGYLEKNTDDQLFFESTQAFKPELASCPKCNALGRLSLLGSYSRGLNYFNNGSVSFIELSIERYRCDSCNATHALLPGNVLIPYGRYSLKTILLVLCDYFERTATVREICQKYQIAISTLYDWKHRFEDQMALLLGQLAAAQTASVDLVRRLIAAPSSLPQLRTFFETFGFSFLQNRPIAATHTQPP